MMKAHEMNRSNANRLIEWLIFCLIAFPAALVSRNQGLELGRLIDTDSYNRLNRVEAIRESGEWLHHVPRDNAGHPTPVHWSHALDLMILGFSHIPAFWSSRSDSLMAAGAVIGPLSILTLAWASMVLVRELLGLNREPLLVGVMIAASPTILSYGALGRADYHVLLPAVAVAMIGLLVRADRSESKLPAERSTFLNRDSFLSGLFAGIGIWISPEAFPFAVAAWAMATLLDIERTKTWNRFSKNWSLGFLISIVAAWIGDPPYGGLSAVEIDRISRPFVELALGLTLVTFLGAHGLRLWCQNASLWKASVLHGLIGTVFLGLWLAIYPDAARGTQGIFSPEMTLRVWSKLSELQPMNDWSSFVEFGLFPCLATIMVLSAIPFRLFSRPLVVLHLLLLLFVLAITVKHIRFAVYLQAWAVILAGTGWYAMSNVEAVLWRRALIRIACFLLLFGHMVAAPWVQEKNSKSASAENWNRRMLSRDLEPFAGQIALVPINQSPESIYYSRCICTAGPYHRAESKMAMSLDAFEEKSWDSLPESFSRTGATVVIVFDASSFKEGSLGAALKAGITPSWLRLVADGEDRGYRIYQLQPNVAL